MRHGGVTFEKLKCQLLLEANGRLTLNGLPMILLPRHFFRYILREVRATVGPEAFHKMFRKAGYDGAVTFCEAFQKSHGCSPQEAFLGYFDQMSMRGWGHFKIEKLDVLNGEAEVWLANSALLEEEGMPSGHSIWEGAVLGAMAYLQNHTPQVKHRAEAAAGYRSTPGSGSHVIRVYPGPGSTHGG